MVYLGGPIGPRRRRGLYLHDPPPGYHPPTPRLSVKDQQRQARQEWILVRVATVILVLTAAAVLVMVSLIIATHS
jgi:hypothetical protein